MVLRNKKIISMTMAIIFVLAMFVLSGCNTQATTTDPKAETYTRPDFDLYVTQFLGFVMIVLR